MDSDLDDIQKLQSALSAPPAENDISINEASCHSDSGDGFAYQTNDSSQDDASFCIFEELSTDSREDEDQLVIDEMDPSLENTLVLNKAYQTLLLELLQKLEVLKVVNLNRQKLVAGEIKELESIIKQKKKKGREKKRRIPFTFFGIPYFKDYNFNCPPKNDDVVLAEKIGFRSIVATGQSKLFSKYETRRLLVGLKSQALTIQATRLMKKRAELQDQLKQKDSASMSASDRESIAKELGTIQREIFEVSEWPDEKLLDLDPAKVDWQKIAIENFERSRHPDQIRLYFTHYMHPKVNKQLWNTKEMRHLKELVRDYDNGIDWDELAEKLGTGRSPYECFRLFQERFNPQHRKFGWDIKDNKKFISLLSQYGDKSSKEIDWDELRLHFPGRSKCQLYAHFRYHLQAKGCRYTIGEDTLILEGVRMGFKIADIALLMGKRTPLEVGFRHKVLKKYGRTPCKPWTEEEDKALLEISDARKLVFVLNSKREFPGRTLPQLFSRFHFLRMKKTTPQEYINELKARTKKTHFRTSNFTMKAIKLMGLPITQRPKYNDKVPLKNSILPKLKRGMVYRTLSLTNELLPGHSYPSALSKQRIIARKLKDLKEIVRPYMNVYTKRVRTITYPGDGREGGIILACLYRMLRGNFTLAPREDPTEEEMEALGVDEYSYPAYQNFIMLLNEMEADTEPGKIICLPPTLTTLTGFRGLLLHRKYIISSAKQEYTAPETSRARLVEIEDSESRPGSSGQMEDTEMEVESSQLANKGSLESREKIVTSTPEPLPTASIDVQLDGLEKQCPMANVNDENSSSSVPDRETENLIEILPDNPQQAEYILEPDDTLFDEAQEFFNQQTDSEDESELEDDEAIPADFGNKEADSLLLSRLLSLFYWPGIMSTINVTEDMRRTAEQITPDPIPEPTPEVNPRIRKLQVRQIRREHIQAVVRKRFGQKNPPPQEASTSSETPSTSAEAPQESAPKPPPPKKTKRDRKSTAPAPITTPPVERVTRSRSKSAAGS